MDNQGHFDYDTEARNYDLDLLKDVIQTKIDLDPLTEDDKWNNLFLFEDILLKIKQ